MKRETIQQENHNYKRIFPAVFFCALLFIGLFFAAPPALASHFTITVFPLSGIIDQGEQVGFIATATCVSGPCGEVSFSINGLPAGASASFLIGSCVPNCSTFVTINSGSASYGFYTISVQGTDVAADSADSPPTFNLTIGYNIKGWAWSDGIGWISFNSENCDTNQNGIMDAGDTGFAGCPSLGTTIPQYGTHLDLVTYELSGYAWSEHIGWITFNKSDAGTPSQAPFNDNAQDYIARYNAGNRMIEGWARAISCSDADCGTDWGWIKMSGTAPDGSQYGAHHTSGEFDDFAWGDLAMGWISFSSKNCDDNGLLAVTCGGDGSKPFAAHNPVIHPDEYKVWISGALPNSFPSANNLTASFLDRCNASLNPNFTFDYLDSVEGDPLTQYTIKVYEQGGTLIDTILMPAQYDGGGNVVSLANSGGSISYTYLGSQLSYNEIYYFTVTVQDETHLSIAQSDLSVYTSGFFKTDPHQRPYISGITWQPLAYFAGDTSGVTFTPSVKVYSPLTAVLGDLTAQQPLDGANYFSYTSNILWNFATSSSSIYSSANFSPIIVFGSGNYSISLTVADNTSNVCGPNQNEPCACTYLSNYGSGGGIDVPKPRPNFREIKP